MADNIPEFLEIAVRGDEGAIYVARFWVESGRPVSSCSCVGGK